MGLVDHHKIPVRTEEILHHLLLLGEVDRGDDAVVLLPRVAARRPLDPRVEHLEVLVELLGELGLPLRSERRGAEDQDAIGNPTELKLLHQQAGHDCLPGPGVIGEDEAKPRLGQHVAVDPNDLMWEPADPGHAHREVGIVRVGELDSVGLDEVEEIRGVGELLALLDDLDRADLVLGKDRLVQGAGGRANTQLNGAVHLAHPLEPDRLDEVAWQANRLAYEIVERRSSRFHSGRMIAYRGVARPARRDASAIDSALARGSIWPSGLSHTVASWAQEP